MASVSGTIRLVDGNYSSHLDLSYTVTSNDSARTWYLSSSLTITIPAYYTFGPWSHIGSYTGNLQANGLAQITAGSSATAFTLATYERSGSYEKTGYAPNITVSWAFNVNSPWGGYNNSPHGEVNFNGPAIDPVGYTIRYNANGGNSTPSNQTQWHGSPIYLAGAISRSNSTANGYTVSFNGNGGTYSGSSKTATNTISYSFSSWKSSNSGSTYSAGAWFQEDASSTMTAQWSSSTSRGSVTLPAASTVSRTYYTFVGWNTNSSGTGTNYSGGSSYTPSSNTTLYAKWTANAPINLSLTRNSSTINSITFSYSDTGVVSTRTLYYKKHGVSGYNSIAITTNPFTISGLDVDTDYDIYYTAANSDNSSSTTVQQFSTLLTNPTITNITYNNLTPFEVDITATASITPTRTLNYQFSNDGGSTWTTAQASNTYHWAGLTEETLYVMGVKVIGVHTSTNAVDTYVTDNINVTTPADQAKIRIKTGGAWVKGKLWYKNNGSWVKAKKVYIKKNGEWIVGYNYENN